MKSAKIQNLSKILLINPLKSNFLELLDAGFGPEIQLSQTLTRGFGRKSKILGLLDGGLARKSNFLELLDRGFSMVFDLKSIYF